MPTTGTLSQEIFNAREQAVTGDLMRLQALASRDLQNILQGDSLSDQALPLGQGVPISGMAHPPIWGTHVGTFNTSISLGSAFFEYDPGGLTADQSSYQVVRWTGATVTHAAPHASMHRIDTIYATPAMVPTDSTSRNVIVDPVARTVGSQTVFKTNNPNATISLVTGTPAVPPLPPAVPAGSLPVMHVLVPAAATDSLAFSATLATGRRAAYPFSGLNTILQGLRLVWDQTVTYPTSTSDITAGDYAPTSPGNLNKICIDGEVLEWRGTLTTSGAGGGIIQDTVNNPFGSAPTNNTAYYIWAVGGHSFPYPSYNPLNGTFSPVTLVESLVPPLASGGRPFVALNTPMGATSSAVLVGVGFVIGGTTNRMACVMSGDMVYAAAGGVLATMLLGASGGGGPHLLPAIPSATIPVGASRMEVTAFANVTGAGGNGGNVDDHTYAIVGGTASVPASIATFFSSFATLSKSTGMFVIPALRAGGGSGIGTCGAQGVLYFPRDGTAPRFWSKGYYTTSDSLAINVHGFNHGVGRMDGMGGL
jgi:hypothetical protein